MDKLEFSIASEIGNIVKVENFIDYFSDVVWQNKFMRH